MGSIYWSSYERIEAEVINLSHSICFDDNQVNVYSNEILDLILRICTNIESLYEDIYRSEFSEPYTKIGDIVSKLNEIFLLDSKVIHIRNDNFHFLKFLRDIKPFEYRAKSREDFYSSYCALKHDRGKNIAKANVSILLRSLAAFYILCIIYDDTCVLLDNDLWGTRVPLDYSYRSNIFSVDVYDRQLAIAEESMNNLALMIATNSKNENPDKLIKSLMAKCQENLHIKFREQKPEECLFAAQLTAEYLKRLDAFKLKHASNLVASRTELALVFGEYADDKTFDGLDASSLDILAEQITMSLSRNTTSLVVNRLELK